MRKIYAGIGSRNLSKDDIILCKNIGRFMAQEGWSLATGGASGADQAFAEGALSNNGNVYLYLPWSQYNSNWVKEAKTQGAQTHTLYPGTQPYEEAIASVYEHHPNASKLKRGAKLLHARNWLIIKNSVFVIAFPGKRLGGTGQGIRITEGLGKEVIRLDTTEGRNRVERRLANL